MLTTGQLEHFARAADTIGTSPCLLIDPEILIDRCLSFKESFPNVALCYAYKSFNHSAVVDTIDGHVDGYDVASPREIEDLLELGVTSDRMRYSNPVKSKDAIQQAAVLGVRRFAYQSEEELAKLSDQAPGSSVYLRLSVHQADGALDFSSKFGADPGIALSLLAKAADLGLNPLGVTFNVGSQAEDKDAWWNAFDSAIRTMHAAATAGLEPQELNIGGGFPVHYQVSDRSSDELFSVINHGIAKVRTLFPQVMCVAEPGRFIGADSGVVKSTVIGKERRGGKSWLYLDTGTFQSFIECFEFGEFRHPVYSLRHVGQSADSFASETYALTGPTCDSYDTMTASIELPIGIEVDDTLLITMAGSYTVAYGSHFNGFSPPKVIAIGEVHEDLKAGRMVATLDGVQPRKSVRNDSAG